MAKNEQESKDFAIVKPKKKKVKVYPADFPPEPAYPGTKRIFSLVDSKATQPGDLVLCTVDKIYHPDVDYHSICLSFLLTGVVKSFTFVK